jgi:hypothetical protein
VLTNIPPDFHEFPKHSGTYILLWLLSRMMSASRAKSAVTGFFSVLNHVRKEYRQFRDED